MNNTNDDGSASASLQLAAESASPAAAASGAAVVETATTPHRSSSSLIPPTFYEDDCLLTPLSHNRGWVGDDGVVVPASSSSMAVTENSNSNINIIGVAAPPVVLATNSNDDDTTDDAIIIPPLMILSGNEEIMELVINNNGNNIDNIHNNYSEEEDDAVLKTYTRKLSALSGCTPTTSGSENCNEDSPSSMSNTKNNNNNAGVASNNEGEEEEYDTPRFSSSLSFVENKKRQPLQQQPQQQQPQILTMEDMEINRVERSLGDSGGGGGGSCTTSQAVIVGDDEVTETSFTTMTTVGGGGGGSSNGDSMVEFGGGGLPSPPVMTEQHQFTYPQQQQQQYLQQRTSLPSLLLSSRRGGGGGGSSGGSRNGVRSPRPPRRMRAVDWCPNNSIVGGGGGGSGMSGSNNNSLPSSDKTAASTRAVRLGDDATVTTFATMTTMGDAGSTTLLLEGEMIEDGTATAASSDDEMLHEGEEEEEEDDEMEEEEEKEENQSMMLEDVKEENIVGAFVVDKIPRSSYKRKQQVRMQQQQLSKQTSLSGTTTRAVRGSTYDDQYSVVTFATMTTVGGGGMGIEDDNDQDVVDKVPSLLASTTTDTTSIVTNDTVLMGDNRSLATWATTNTMGGQLTGNVIDHVPSSMDNGVPSSLSSSSNVTIGTSNAVNDDPSIMTFTTSAADDISDINEMVDKIPTFAGGGRGNGRSIASGLTSQAVFERKMIFSGGDDRSVTSFATMTTMGDLGSIVETAEDLEDDEVDISNSSFFQLRPRAFMNHDIIDRRSAVVDVIPEAASSVASDTTNHSIGASVTTFGTMTTAGGRAERDAINNENDNSAVVDHVPNFSVGGDASIISGTTNHAIRSNDDQSVATWLTSTTSGVAAMLGSSSMRDQNIVDEIPSFNEDQSEEGGTNRAVRDAEDQSVVTWNTMTTAAIGGGSYLPGPYAVDRLPSFSSKWSSLAGASMSGTTNHRVGGGDDQSVVTFATVTTIGGDRGNEGLSKNNMVDKVPSFASSRIDARSIITDETVQMGDNQSLMTWATTNTMGGQLTGNVVDHVPAADISASSSDHVEIDEEDVTLGTTNAVKDDPSVTTFTTSAMSGGAVSCIDEVVDRIPTFAGGSGQSVTSGITYQAVRMGDDRSLASFATMATTGYDPGNSYESDVLESSSSSNSNSRRSYPNNDHIVDKIPSSSTTISTERTDFAVRLGDDMTEATFATVTTAGEGGQSSVKYPRSDQIVDQIPSSSTSVVSGRTSDAVRLGDDLTEATFATVTSVVVGNDVPTTTYPGVEENTDVLSRSSSSVRSQIAAATPTTGILRESRHGRPPSALRSAFESVTAEPNDPIDLGESVSNTHILRAIADLRFHVDYRIGDLREVNRRDSERVLQIVQQEQAKRTALEAKLHSQLLLQSESMVAMELKLLRLEAKVSGRDTRRQQRRQPGIGGNAATVSDRPPPIATASSTPNHSDEEADSFEELELTPRGTNRNGNGIGSGMFPNGGILHRNGGPANIAVVTRSGASVASAVTATSFQEGDFSHAVNDSERSDDGDIEDEGDNNDDGSASTPTQSSRNRISNLESILLNPSREVGINDQGLSTQAIRGDTDGMSSLPTSVTSTTMASTVVTSTTRGNESIGITHISSQLSDENIPNDEVVVEESGGDVLRSQSEESIESASRSRPRSRSQSPLTVLSANTGVQSLASASLGPSILSTAAVASSRSFGTRRAHAAVANAEGIRSMANRVVSFTTNDLTVGTQSSSAPPMQENDGGGCDSITMPDELDNFSDVADAFSNSSRAWREEYEARLDAIQKRLGN